MKNIKQLQKWISELVQRIYWNTGLLYFKDYQCNLTDYAKMEQLLLQLLDEINDWEKRNQKKLPVQLLVDIDTLIERLREKKEDE